MGQFNFTTGQTASGVVDKSLFDAHTILMAILDNTPIALTVTEQTLVGRLTGENITAVALGISDNNVVQIASSSVAATEYAKFIGNGLESRSYQELVNDISGVIKATDVEVSELSTAFYDDVQDYINFFGDRTLLTGGGITDNGNGTVTVASGTAWAKATDSDTAVGKFFDFSADNSVSLTNLSTNHIYVYYNGGTPQIVVDTSFLTHGFKQDYVHIAIAFRDGNTSHFHATSPIGIGRVNRADMHHREEHPVHRASGIVTSSIGTRNLGITTGVLYEGVSRHTTSPFDTPNSGTADQTEAFKLHDADGGFAATDVGKTVHNTGGDNTYAKVTAHINSGELTLDTDIFTSGETYDLDIFTYWYATSSGTVWNEVTGSTQISNTQYNDVTNGGLSTLTANRYGVHWVYMEVDGEHFHVLYGQGDYKANQAEEASVPAVSPDIVNQYCALIAKIIVQKNTDTLLIMYPWTDVFTSTLATDHNSLANLTTGDVHTQYVKHALATAANDFLVASGSGAYVKKTLAETLALISPLSTRGDMMFMNASVNTRLAKGNDNTILAMGANDPEWKTPAVILGDLTGASLDVGAYDVRGQTITADGLTSGRVVFTGASGVLSDNAGFLFGSDTLTVTKIGAFEATGAINFANQNMTNVDIDSGTIGGVTLDGAIAGGDQAFTGVGDMTFTAGSILKSGGSNGNTLLLAANDTTLITLTTGATDVLDIGAHTLSGKLTAGATEIEGSAFDINGGTIAGVTLDGNLAGGGYEITALDRQKYNETNLLENGDFEVGDPPTGWTGARSTLAQEGGAGMHPINTYSLKVTATSTSGTAYAYRDIGDPARYLGRKVTLGAWCYAPSANVGDAYLGMFDNGTAARTAIPKDDAWHWLTVTREIANAASIRISLIARLTGTDLDVAYFDGAIIVEGDSCPAFSPKPMSVYNGTLVSPTINGIIATTGLTLPAFTSGNITMTGAATVDGIDVSAHANNTTTVHGAVSTATASKHVVRDASARAKFAAPGAAGDALIKGTRVTTAELPAMTDEKIWVGTGANVEERDVPTSAVYALATVALFQTNPATGDFYTASSRINNNNPASVAQAKFVAEYAEVDFGQIVTFKRYRQYGKTGQNSDGTWKIQYFDIPTQTWVDWVTGIPTRNTEDWSNFATVSTISAQKIKLVATAIDSGGIWNSIGELEVIY